MINIHLLKTIVKTKMGYFPDYNYSMLLRYNTKSIVSLKVMPGLNDPGKAVRPII